MKIPKILITPEILNLISEIDEFKGGWSFLENLNPEKLNTLKRIATIESVASSTRIEGVKLSDAEVERLLSGLQTNSFKSRDEEEVVGYAAVMETIFDSYAHIDLTENFIKQLHGILLKYSAKDIRHRGEYKKFPNDVQAFDAQGKSLGVIFSTTIPFDTPIEMRKLIEWTNQAFLEKKLHSLLVISIFVVHFLAIHPFQDGNGRLSRAITTLLLIKSGYMYVPYSSIESIIELNKDSYYLALRKAQKTINTDNYNIEPWILFFLSTLKKQKDNLQIKLDQIKASIKLPELSRNILELAKSLGNLTLTTTAENIKANKRTIREHIYRLVEQGYLIKHGDKKSAWYSLNL